jgi:glucan phosphoethanolaminetransferase (alkaline phosphatase superfamily)
VNWPYIHTLINHFPIILTVVGSAVLLLAFIVKRRGVWLYALATLTLAGASIYPAFYTGDAAAHALRNTWYVVRATVEEHDQSAGFALPIVLVMGIASAYAWWRLLRREVTGLPPVWLRVVVGLLAVLGLAVVARTAYLGGKIIHESPKLERPPAVPTAMRLHPSPDHAA